MSTNDEPLRIDGISKKFGKRQALEPLTLSLIRGEIFGLLGHNGAGKSTTFGIVLGLIRPDAGDVYLEGVSVRHHRPHALRSVGAIFEAPAFHDYLSGIQNLRLLVAYSGPCSESRLRETLELVGLDDRRNDRVRTYSHGMRQRLALAQALLPHPTFILLDEPTEGLDPEGIEEFRRLVLRLRDERGITFLLASHLLSEVERICDRVAILNNGRLAYCGRWNASESNRYRFVVDAPERLPHLVAEFGGKIAQDGIVVFPAAVDPSDVIEKMVHAGLRIRAAEPVRMSLEDFYLDQNRS